MRDFLCACCAGFNEFVSHGLFANQFVEFQAAGVVVQQTCRELAHVSLTNDDIVEGTDRLCVPHRGIYPNVPHHSCPHYVPTRTSMRLTPLAVYYPGGVDKRA
jgi:hypothetical protein